MTTEHYARTIGTIALVGIYDGYTDSGTIRDYGYSTVTEREAYEAGRITGAILRDGQPDDDLTQLALLGIKSRYSVRPDQRDNWTQHPA